MQHSLIYLAEYANCIMLVKNNPSCTLLKFVSIISMYIFLSPKEFYKSI